MMISKEKSMGEKATLEIQARSFIYYNSTFVPKTHLTLIVLIIFSDRLSSVM